MSAGGRDAGSCRVIRARARLGPITTLVFDTPERARTPRERARLAAEQAEGTVRGVRGVGPGRPADPRSRAGSIKAEFAGLRSEIAAFQVETRDELAAVRAERKLLAQRMTIERGAILIAAIRQMPVR
ncbi:hypothetical protein FF100_18505 [Methylobacterium terricola]|uniref:Uncharacterized protein n=1 Tax=Methylobacterium terricola TaxID=2583531 RepID=A0A5C4LFV4_9HYPH|nr:hypothetical protein [Methylobacterium terricola]TNC11638.1 hypothetical protein FF100_18505 [Methylobacterium terricola]